MNQRTRFALVFVAALLSQSCSKESPPKAQAATNVPTVMQIDAKTAELRKVEQQKLIAETKLLFNPPVLKWASGYSSVSVCERRRRVYKIKAAIDSVQGNPLLTWNDLGITQDAAQQAFKQEAAAYANALFEILKQDSQTRIVLGICSDPIPTLSLLGTSAIGDEIMRVGNLAGLEPGRDVSFTQKELDDLILEDYRLRLEEARGAITKADIDIAEVKRAPGPRPVNVFIEIVDDAVGKWKITVDQLGLTDEEVALYLKLR